VIYVRSRISMDEDKKLYSLIEVLTNHMKIYHVDASIGKNKYK